jgi:hypothetical protein
MAMYEFPRMWPCVGLTVGSLCARDGRWRVHAMVHARWARVVLGAPRVACVSRSCCHTLSATGIPGIVWEIPTRYYHTSTVAERAWVPVCS